MCIRDRYIDNVGTAEEIVTLYKNSVNKYGGFYIARYEAGSESKRTESSGTADTAVSYTHLDVYKRQM